MTAIIRAFVAASVCSAAASAQSQKPIPIRQLAPIEATTAETWTSLLVRAWEWPDGRIAVTERTRNGKILVYDAKLGSARVLADSSLVSAGMMSFGSFIALPYLHDTTAIVDARSAGVLLLDRDGKEARIMALPNGRDAQAIGTGYYGNAIDRMGRLHYRVGFARPPGSPPPVPSETPATIDSTAIVRADFVRRVVDTVAAVRSDVAQLRLPDVGEGPEAIRRLKMVPGGGSDDWAVLADGSVAIVRHHDYHIDWVYADGTRASTPKMPFDWRRRTDEEKQAIIDTTKRQNAMIDSLMNRAVAGRPAVPSLVPQRTYATIAEITEYTPPIRGANSLYPDADNRLWILPTTSSQARGGLLFDVVNTKGEIEERVQLPANAAIAGFGKNGVVFLRIVRPDRTNVVARTHIVR